MAEITQPSGQKRDAKVRTKKHSTRIDMTPMVDLAFLLLTFFILTSTFNNRTVMDVEMPDKEDDISRRTPITEKNVLNLVLAKDNKVYWWMGFGPKAQETNYSKAGVRKLLVDQAAANPHLVVLIKPCDDSRFENIVDLLDEIAITHTKKFAVVDFTEDDKKLITLNRFP